MKNATKNIFWRKDLKGEKGMMFANVHLLVGYNQGSIEDYKEMADELRKTFPEAKDSDIRCSHVIKSHSCDRFTIIMYDALIPKKSYKKAGWREYDNNGCEYCWA